MSLILGLLCLFSAVDVLSAKDAAVVFVVDPSWDCVASYVANVPLLQEYKIVKVMTHLGKVGPCGAVLGRQGYDSDPADIYANITYNSWTPNDALAAEEICPQLMSLGVPIAAVIPTFDPAVYLTDRLAACVGVRGNPFEGPLAKARRDKLVTNEAVRKAGIRAVKEKVVTTWNEAKEYLESLKPPLSQANPVIFKILAGSSSMGVQKVVSLKQAEEIFRSEIGSKSFFGEQIGQLLIQEFLQGKEYVIDSASRDGVHKVVMVWHEDIRPGNGIDFLYLGFIVMDPKDEKTKKIIDYANKVLDATGLRNGAADMEVIWLEEEGTPCVVDLNARWTALMWDQGLALSKATVGNDQITATVNAYLDIDAFNKMSPVPSIKQYGALVFTENFYTGILRDIPGLAVAQKLPSYFGMRNVRAFKGKMIHGIRASSTPLYLLLAHKKKAVVHADYARIIALEWSHGFFDITPLAGNTSLTALRPGKGGLSGHQLPAVPALVMLAVAAVLALAANSQRNVQDGTEYLTIE